MAEETFGTALSQNLDSSTFVLKFRHLTRIGLCASGRDEGKRDQGIWQGLDLDLGLTCQSVETAEIWSERFSIKFLVLLCEK